MRRPTAFLPLLLAASISAAPSRAAELDADSPPQAGGMMAAHSMLTELMRERCTRDFPADAARYDAVQARWLQEETREIAVATWGIQMAMARFPKGAEQFSAQMHRTMALVMPAASAADALDAATLHARCEKIFSEGAAAANREMHPSEYRFLRDGACTPAATAGTCDVGATLAEARRGFRTSIAGAADGASFPKPPAGQFDLVTYPSALGPLGALRTPAPKDGARHPAIVWIHGGDSNSIDDVWTSAPRSNDQTAAAYRHAGIVMMFPSLRGGNTNPGHREGLYGEVDDVLAAADFLARQPGVDPERIYLGGHSTGGTLALLTAEVSARFRAVFAFGPVANAVLYGRELVDVDARKADPRETTLRAPILWLSQVRGDTWVIEGADAPSNADDLAMMRGTIVNSKLHFLRARGATHFSVLAPANALLARKILQDGHDSAGMALDERQLDAAIAAN